MSFSEVFLSEVDNKMYLCLSRVPINGFIYNEKVVKKDEIIILTDNNYLSGYVERGYRTVGFEDYLMNEKVLEYALSIVEKYKISHILISDESDVERAAYIREKKGLKGQLPLSASAYRDKFFMKSLLKEKVKVPYFQLCDSKETIEMFLKRFGKCIVKPVSAWSSNNITIVNNLEDISKINMEENLIVEEWVNQKKMYTVDGIQDNGKVGDIFIHEYDTNVAESLNYDGFSMFTSSKNLDESFLKIVKKYSETVIRILNMSEDFISPFHLEFFISETEELVFCEIASRFGGGKTMDLINSSFGVSLPELYIAALNSRRLIKARSCLSKYTLCYKKFRYSPLNRVGYSWILSQSHSYKLEKPNNINQFSSIYVIEGKNLEECLFRKKILENIS